MDKHYAVKHPLFSKSFLRAAIWMSMAAWLILQIGLSPLDSLAKSPLRLGLLGDSTQDEFQGSDQRGGSYHTVTFNWVEQLVKGRGVQVGTWGSYPEPRRTGFAYNWSRSGATAASLIAQGQHTGLAAQVAQGQIDVVVITVGSNDFAPYRSDGYEPIYSGSLRGTGLSTKINTLVAHITTALDTIQHARRIPILITTIPNWSNSPAVYNDGRFTDPAKRQRVTDAIKAANQGLLAMARARGIQIIDNDALYTQLASRLTNDQLWVGGIPINLFASGDEPHHGLLGDGIHAGTVVEGLIANYYIQALNNAGRTHLSPLTDREILVTAGLLPVSPTPLPTNRPPTPRNDAFSLRGGTSIKITFAQLLSNDVDPDGDRLSVFNGTLPQYGTVMSTPDGLGGVYMPRPSFTGIDRFTYVVSDGRGGTASATVTLTVS